MPEALFVEIIFEIGSFAKVGRDVRRISLTKCDIYYDIYFIDRSDDKKGNFESK